MLQAADLTIRLHPDDDVVIARMEIPTGTLLKSEKVTAVVTIPAGHKLAVRDIAQGKPVRRYNQIIGFATRPIKAGEHVHVHNIAMGDFAMVDPAIASTVLLTALNGVATWYDPDGRLPANRVADHLVQLCLRMLTEASR